MPKLTTMTKEEFETTLNKLPPGYTKLSKREKQNRKYIRMLKPFKDGAYVEMKLLKGEKKQTEKNRIKKAAATMDLKLDFKRTRGSIRFQVTK